MPIQEAVETYYRTVISFQSALAMHEPQPAIGKAYGELFAELLAVAPQLPFDQRRELADLVRDVIPAFPNPPDGPCVVNRDALSKLRWLVGMLDLPERMVALDAEDRLILSKHAQTPAMLLTLDKLPVDRKTAVEHIKALCRNGLLIRPKGPHKGTQITPKGLMALENTLHKIR